MSRRAMRVGASFAFALYIFFAALRVEAQAPSSLTPEQLQIYQSLSPEQQQAVLNAMSQSSGGTTGGPQPAAGTNLEQPDQSRRARGTPSGLERANGSLYGR